MILSNDGLVAFHYRSYGTFFLHKNRLHNIYRGFTHYKYYRAFLFLSLVFLGIPLQKRESQKESQTDPKTDPIFKKAIKKDTTFVAS